MKNDLSPFRFVLSVTINRMAQMTYKDGKTPQDEVCINLYDELGDGRTLGVHGPERHQMHIHAADPRMSTTTNKLVFLIASRSLYIDLYCRTMYQISMKTEN